MSFKRDGNDTCLLNNLQRRRVGELLVGHIPEDEAVLLKNGRYSCTVCIHRPIFDTLEMLAIHRKGKKHLYNLTRHLQQQQELKDLKMRRIQELNVQNVELKLPQSCNPQLTKRHCLLKAKPYNSCNKKRSKGKSNKFSRKHTLMLDDVQTDNTMSSSQDMPQDTRPSQDTTPSTKSLIKSYLKTIQKKKNFCDVVEKQRRQCVLPNTSTETTAVPAMSSSKAVEKQSNIIGLPDKTVPVSEEKKKRTEFFVNLRQQGWKKDLSGNWIKDEDAEFDTDDETPPEYPG